jgi:alpha-mannosidase
MRSVHLVCNAHIDPVWLWEWEEGAAEALSTFRVAADLCEEFDAFVFNHNEAVLYRWIEEYEPALFRRIRRLVRRGRWHIMGGWYVQPDCNMPSGESFVRQILLGREYFRRAFGAAPTTAINFDPFGHSRGLVQILARSGYDAYVHCRPGQADCPLPADAYVWEGFDGSRVLATRPWGAYGTHYGHAREKVEDYLAERPDERVGLILWGVGNHGGGPSRGDLRDLEALIAERTDVRIRHSTPEAYFRELADRRERLPVHRGDLNLWAPGCYTSQVRVKQRHRRLENELFATEKMAAAAWATGRMDYPADEFHEAMRDLALCQFHDILPGSSIAPGEASALRMLDHGLHELSRIKARAFFALAAGQRAAPDGTMPILVYNPHPFPVRTLVECEIQPSGQNREGGYTEVTVHGAGGPLPTQTEKEESSIPIDWRKRVVFAAELAPGRMNRFDARLHRVPARPAPRLKARRGKVVFRTDDLRVVVNTRTGLIDQYRAGGIDLLGTGACRPLVIADNFDPWGMTVRSFRKLAGRFRLLSAADSARLAGVRAPRLPAVRVIEDGPVRSIVEAVFGYEDSFLCQRYKFPKRGTEIEVEIRVFWNEKDRMLKLALPTPDPDADYCGQVAYGVDRLRSDGTEVVAQRWTAVVSEARGTALTCINDGTYGSDCKGGELRLSLLRSPAYAAHPIGDREVLPADRFSPRIDQGERAFRFWLNGGPARRRLNAVDREATARNEPPMALSFFPAGEGARPKPFVILSDRVVELAAAKRAERDGRVILRLFNPTARRRKTTVRLPFARTRKTVTLGGFEIRTLAVDVERRDWADVDLLER